MKLAIVKPDHLGDVVLSSPAIRALAARYSDLTLFVASRCHSLATALFPGIKIEILDLAHLSKETQNLQALPDFSTFDAVALLRRDHVITPQWAFLRMPRFAMFEDSHAWHQTILDYGVAREFAPPYDIDAMFYGEHAERVAAKASAEPSNVGLSIGSGFYANSWPAVRWIELGRALRRQGRDVAVVHGPAEATLAKIIAQEIQGARTLRGGGDFRSFFDEVDRLDLVIASDGGTAHLCSMTTPILSIFGPSPVRRYAPTGQWNRVLTQMLSCSPCCQYAERLVNGCLSVECMSGVLAEDVLTVMDDRVQAGQAGCEIVVREGLRLIKGPSWLNRAPGILARDFEFELWRATVRK